MTAKPEEVKPKNLYQKLVEIMSEMGRVEKRGFNKFHNYSYVTESDLTDALRDKLAQRNIIIIPSLMDVKHDETLTTITMSFTLVDADQPEAQHEIKWAGTGDDKGDKGLYKAYTGALKYFLMKTFLVSQGDDPEGDTKTDQRAENKASQVEGVRCPECNGAMWDNRDSKRNPRAPDYKCKNKNCNGAVWEDNAQVPATATDAGINALRAKIKEAMAALNAAGDVPEWTVQRVNELSKLHFGDVAANLEIESLGKLAEHLSQRLEAIRKPSVPLPEKANIIASIKASCADTEIAEYLIEHCDGRELEELTIVELNVMDKQLSIPF